MKMHQKKDIYGQIQFKLFPNSITFYLDPAGVAVVNFTVCATCSVSRKAKRQTAFLTIGASGVRKAQRINSPLKSPPSSLTYMAVDL